MSGSFEYLKRAGVFERLHREITDAVVDDEIREDLEAIADGTFEPVAPPESGGF